MQHSQEAYKNKQTETEVGDGDSRQAELGGYANSTDE